MTTMMSEEMKAYAQGWKARKAHKKRDASKIAKNLKKEWLQGYDDADQDLKKQKKA